MPAERGTLNRLILEKLPENCLPQRCCDSQR